jgi:hypothetical protein
MLRRSLRLLAPSSLAAVALWTMASMTLLTVAFTDYEVEALPSVAALLHGNAQGFLDHLPAYGGSLVIRAPFAWFADALGGGELAVYRALAVPCLAAAAWLGVSLWSRLARPGRAAGLAAWAALAVVVVNPVMLPALRIGHPEEILGAVLCVAAVLAALGDRPVLAGVLLGLAVANKAWAIFAIVPVLVALEERRFLALSAGAAVAGVILVPTLIGGSTAGRVTGPTGDAGDIFQPWQIYWFLGDHAGTVMGLSGEKPGFRTGPGWVAGVAHPLVVAVPLLVAAAAAALRRVSREQALLLLALCMLLRCVLDPWNTAYYHLPFLFALAAYEVAVRRRAPAGALAATAAVYLGMTTAEGHVSPEVQAALYLAWTLPTCAALSAAAFAPAWFERRWAPLVAFARTRLPVLTGWIAATAPPGRVDL